MYNISSLKHRIIGIIINVLLPFQYYAGFINDVIYTHTYINIHVCAYVLNPLTDRHETRERTRELGFCMRMYVYIFYSICIKD